MKCTNIFEMNEFDYRKIVNKQKTEIKELNSEIENLKKQLAIESEEKNNILNSKSWKITKPLRYVTSTFKSNCFKFTSSIVSNDENDPQNYKNFIPYDSVYQDNKIYEDMKTDIKAIAFYLPQFHTFPENDKWWGKGFTEWTNTRKSIPRFDGHYQPRTPHKDIGFYDLSNFDVMKNQIKLAKQHGIYGFCFYYYWFSGKRLMEKPVDMLLDHPEIDFPFCLCWANENWTRTWDGQEKNVLMEQEYSTDDYRKFIIDIKKYVNDKRYIRIEGKPVILVYNPYEIPNVQEQFKEWRRYAIEEGIGEIVIWSKNNLADVEFERTDYVDGEFDFSPTGLGHPASLMTGLPFKRIINYKKLVSDIEHLYDEHFPVKPFYYSCMMGWDNSARRKDGFVIYNAYSLKSFYDWLKTIIKWTRKRHKSDRRFILINAWNEWAEGTYLEPDEKYGYANINTLSKAIYDLPFNDDVTVITNKKISNYDFKEKIAVQIHLFYVDLIDEIIEQLKFIPFKFDIYITTDTKAKVKIIEEKFYDAFDKKRVIVNKCTNRGRDVAPFLIQMNNVIKKYDYVAHIHTKKSCTGDYGDSWRQYLYKNLFGTENNVRGIFELFKKDPKIGLIFPETFIGISEMMSYGGNKEAMTKLSRKMRIDVDFNDENLTFPSGTMFWARTDAIKPLFDLKLSYNDFAKEEGQIDGTLAHAIERIFCFLVKAKGYNYIKTLNRTFDNENGGVKWYHL